MVSGLTPAEARLVRAVCASGPMGIDALSLSKTMGVSAVTVRNLATLVERKGFCRRERYGARVFLRATELALGLTSEAATEDSSLALESPTPRAIRPRAPRMARGGGER